MKQVSYTDETGRRWAVLVPDQAVADEYRSGVPVGPPPTDHVGLPEDVAVRLHNELHDRGILTERDARRRSEEIAAALRAALRVDVTRIMAAFAH